MTRRSWQRFDRKATTQACQLGGDYKDDIESPAKVPPPKLKEEVAPPAFVEPDGWLDDLRQDVRVEFHCQETENPRVSPVALVRALHELAWALRGENDTDSIIYVSFNGLTSLSSWETSQPLEALCRRILFAALGDEDTRRFRNFNESTVVKKGDVTD
jgi:hypothetical protein